MSDYQQVTPQFIEALKKISGDRVMVGPDVNPDYARDEMPIYGTRMPSVSIDVLTTEEISAIMKLCYGNNIPVTCRGAGTGLVGACTPIAGGVVLCIILFNTPAHHIDYAIDRMIDTGVGVVISLLINYLLPRRRLERWIHLKPVAKN